MIYDISQPVFGCEVYPGDPCPEKKTVMSMDRGDLYNLTCFSMCAHNGTHVDAPLHFIAGGRNIGDMPLEKFIGPAYVETRGGDISAEAARCILNQAAERGTGAGKRILIKGNAVITLEAAKVFAEAGIWLVGTESQTVGPESGPMAVHLALLGAGVVLLEGIRLSGVTDGVYLLNCAPLNLGTAEGAPCRATLMDFPL